MLIHFPGYTAKYHNLCKPCYDEEMRISAENELRSSKKMVYYP